ncbi:hypothetical protein [Roseomonas rosulenta]|uniref:hypothetical protein n=1 Tax=Roseomonas rosulenta TaxID=2748667 RepID=UPI0018DF0DA0|nr:hypothetical protein [Roseomonas rosulenta]
MTGRRILAVIGHEVREMIPPTIFFALGFNLIVLTGHLMTGSYGRQLFSFTIATTTALVVGKSVLLANALPLMRRFDGAPLLYPILFKSFVYWLVVLVMRLLEAMVESWIGDGSAIVAFNELEARFSWDRFLAVQIWILVLFLVYVTADELNALFGAGELRRIFLTWAPPTFKRSRQQRMRALARIARLAREGDPAALVDEPGPRREELRRLLDELGHRPAPPG